MRRLRTSKEQIQDFLEKAVRRQNEPETVEERRERLYKRIDNEKKVVKKKYGL